MKSIDYYMAEYYSKLCHEKLIQNKSCTSIELFNFITALYSCSINNISFGPNVSSFRKFLTKFNYEDFSLDFQKGYIYGITNFYKSSLESEIQE